MLVLSLLTIMDTHQWQLLECHSWHECAGPSIDTCGTMLNILCVLGEYLLVGAAAFRVRSLPLAASLVALLVQ